MITGYRGALRAGADVVVKVDGDGQMDPALIPAFIRPIVRGVADYTKGNRFHSLYAVEEMPLLRVRSHFDTCHGEDLNQSSVAAIAIPAA